MIKKRIIATLLLGLIFTQSVIADDRIVIHDPVGARRETAKAGDTVTFIAGNVEKSFEGESHAEGASNKENTTASQNAQISNAASILRNKLIKENEMAGDLMIKGDTYVVNTFTEWIETYDLKDYVLELMEYETVTGLLPIQKAVRTVDLVAQTEMRDEIIRIMHGVNEQMKTRERLDEVDWEDLGVEDIEWFYQRLTEYVLMEEGGMFVIDEDPTTTDPIIDPISEAMSNIANRINNSGSVLRPSGNEVPYTIEPNRDSGDPKIPTMEWKDPVWLEVGYLIPMKLPMTATLWPSLGLLPDIETPEFVGDIEEITKQLEIILGYELIETWETWSEELLKEWQIATPVIEAGQIKVNENTIGIEYERYDLVEGGIIDTRTLESRFRILNLFLNHISTSDRINTRVITEYQLISEKLNTAIEKTPTDTWVWTVEGEHGEPIAGPIYTKNPYLRFVFNTRGVYRIRAKQVMNVIRADVVSYDRNEYWVLNTRDAATEAERAFDGFVIYRDKRTGMSYTTNAKQTLEEVPVSSFWATITDDMVGKAYIAGPGTGLVGAGSGFNTQRYK
jgi:hypothetical protein